MVRHQTSNLGKTITLFTPYNHIIFMLYKFMDPLFGPWSECLPSTSMIRIRIPLKLSVCLYKWCLKRTKISKKRLGLDHFLRSKQSIPFNDPMNILYFKSGPHFKSFQTIEPGSSRPGKHCPRINQLNFEVHKNGLRLVGMTNCRNWICQIKIGATKLDL